MKPNCAFLARQFVNSSSCIEQLLQEKKYQITRKDCSGVRALRYILREKPSICILKSSYNDLSGLDVVKQAILKKSKTKFIIIFNKISEIDIAIAKKNNVSGCLSCDDSLNEVITCLKAVLKDDDYFSKEILNNIDESYLENYTNFTSFQMKIIAYIGFYDSPEKLAKKLNTGIGAVREEMILIKSQLRLDSKEPLHKWAAQNTSFIETIVLK